MNPISASELASIQADVAAAACDKACVIQRKNTTKDAYGTETETWVTISSPDLKAGMSEPSGGQLQNFDYLIGSLAAFQVKLPVGTDIRTQDHIIVEGQTLIVQIVLDPRSYPSLLTCLATEIKQQ